MIKKGEKCCIVREALEILPFNDKEGDQWLITGVWDDIVTIQRILPTGELEVLIYEVTEEMLIQEE